jgi:hypothetical protein
VFSQGRYDIPDETGLALVGCPGLEVIIGHDAIEASLLGMGGVLHDLGGMEPFEHCRVSDRGACACHKPSMS